MNIYKLSRPFHKPGPSVDVCRGAIVVAADEAAAQLTYPMVDQASPTRQWNGEGWGRDTSASQDMLWDIHPDDVVVTFVGTAAPGLPPGVLLSDVHWG